MNIERLNIIAEWLEAGAPERHGITKFDMGEWNFTTSCGTTCCIGGAAEIFFGLPTNAPWEVLDEALGLDEETTNDLFFPYEVGDRWSAITPAWAARCIRKLIETGEVDWVGTQAA